MRVEVVRVDVVCAPCDPRRSRLYSGMTQDTQPAAPAPTGTGAASALPPHVRVFINERGVTVPRAATALAAVHALDPALGEALAAGRQRLTDSRGLPLDPASPVHGGAIFRLLPVRATAEDLLAESAEAAS